MEKSKWTHLLITLNGVLVRRLSNSILFWRLLQHTCKHLNMQKTYLIVYNVCIVNPRLSFLWHGSCFLSWIFVYLWFSKISQICFSKYRYIVLYIYTDIYNCLILFLFFASFDFVFLFTFTGEELIGWSKMFYPIVTGHEPEIK